MGVGIGLGCAEFPFSGAAAYWRWIDMCEAGGVDSIWQTDRIVGRQPFLESIPRWQPWPTHARACGSA